VVIRDGGLQGALEYLRNAEEAWVIGGARMYEEAAPLMSEFWTTYIAEPHPFDVRFPWQILLGFKVAATKRLAPKIYQERRIPRI
jgi:dihydrofolate reductase